MQITSQIFEAYLKCPTKCWLRSRDVKGAGNIYSEWVRTQSDIYLAEGIDQLINGFAREDVASPHDGVQNFKTAKWKFAPRFCARTEKLESTIHLVERIPPEGRGRPALFTPTRYIFRNKLSKEDKLILAFDAHVLSEMLRRDTPHGKIVHGDNRATLRVRTSPLIATVRRHTSKISTLLNSDSPPDLVLNRHCAECEYQLQCRPKAIDKDDLSLLAGMTEKERKKLNSKGIFTVTQLSYTFRPRRRPNRLRDKQEKYHHSLKALAIREKKIHIVGSPELKIEGTLVFLDVEGLPDRDFYYLIGIRIKNGPTIEQHSLWADCQEEEGKNWGNFLDIISSIEQPVLVHYGSYESDFLKRMLERYGGLSEESRLARVIKNSINVISLIYAQIYFPTYSNGLKDIANFLGFVWSNTESSGIVSIVWRYSYESRDISIKDKLIRYNAEDCEALELISVTIQQIRANKGVDSFIDGYDVVMADSDRFLKHVKWQDFKSQISNLEYINSAAHWDYQRDRIHARIDKSKAKPLKKLAPKRNLINTNLPLSVAKPRVSC